MFHIDERVDEASGDQDQMVNYQSKSLETIGSVMQVLNHKPNMKMHLSLSQSVNYSHILLATGRVWVLSLTNRSVRVWALLDPRSTLTLMEAGFSALTRR